MAQRQTRVDLDPQERRVLAYGLGEWLGPARPTEELAVAMGFAGIADLNSEVLRLNRAILADEPLSPLDWVRALLATEIVFISDMVGSGRDWQITVGIPDDVTVEALRRVQDKILPMRDKVIGREFGTLGNRHD